MKDITLLVQYCTNEKINRTDSTYQLKSKVIEIKPLKITRTPCGDYGEAKHRYFYQAVFNAPDDAAFPHNGVIRDNINRKMNPKFKPKDFVFINNVCDLTGVNRD